MLLQFVGGLPISNKTVEVLNKKNFDKIVMDTSNNVLVEFYTGYCEICRALAPIYETVGELFKKDKAVYLVSLMLIMK